MVLIDSKPYTGNGHIETTLFVGSHNYIIATEGYESAEGSFKLTESAPRTITEHLVAVVNQPNVTENPSTLVASQPSSPSVSSQPISNGIVCTVGNIQFTMIHVEGGTFQMGATKEQKENREDPTPLGRLMAKHEKPVHQVTLSSYYIGETEVTQELWQAVMGSNPSVYKGNRRPVENVSWYDCQIFVNKLTQLTGQQYRLPTEAEWEFAARGGNKSQGFQYSGSNNVGDVAWYGDYINTSTHDVKTKRPNELGIYDMSGSVFEWCQDLFGSYSSGPQTNPTGASSGSERVSRGGSWNIKPWFCRVALRSNNAPDLRCGHLGLRLVLQ
jgi:formylglycine-generating enzyme required for sulfatase activity